MAMLFESKDVRIIFHRYIDPSELGQSLFYYCVEIGEVEFVKSAFLDLNLQAKYDTPSLVYLYTASGNGIITINKETVGIKKNDSFIFTTRDHVQFLSSDATFYYIVFRGNQSFSYYHYLREEQEFIKFVDHTNIFTHYLKIKECISGKDQINEGYISVSLECILAEVYTINHFYGAIGEQVNMVTHAIDYIENNFHKEINLEEICNNVAYSPYYFSRVFKKETNMSPYEYLINRRINHAKHLLITTNEPISSISELCGYNSTIHFSNSFKKLVGMTPSEYRKKYQQT